MGQYNTGVLNFQPGKKAFLLFQYQGVNQAIKNLF